VEVMEATKMMEAETAVEVMEATKMMEAETAVEVMEAMTKDVATEEVRQW
jgi:hypothetical protein